MDIRVNNDGFINHTFSLGRLIYQIILGTLASIIYQGWLPRYFARLPKYFMISLGRLKYYGTRMDFLGRLIYQGWFWSTTADWSLLAWYFRSIMDHNDELACLKALGSNNLRILILQIFLLRQNRKWSVDPKQPRLQIINKAAANHLFCASRGILDCFSIFLPFVG